MSEIDVKELMRAMEYFNEQSQRLTQSYANLEDEVANLNLALDQKNRYLTNILESISNGVVGIDANGTITLVNRAAREMLLIRSDGDILGHNIRDMSIFSEILASCEDLTSDHLRNFSHQATLHLGQDKRRVIEFNLTPLEGDAGTILFFRDLTRIIDLEQQAARNEKLAAMGEMAANIAHEIRNPLGSIELFASLLYRDLAEEPPKQQLCANIVSGVRNLNSVISNLLLFTRNLSIQKENFDPELLLEEVLTFTEHLKYKKRITTLKDIAPGTLLYGDFDLLNQVLLNLVQNAVNSIAEEGTIELVVRDDQGDSEYTLLQIRDSGSGMDPDTLKKIFIPFYTTRAKGTGLGLSIVNRIVETHGGVLNVESEEGVGTTFTIKLPRQPSIQ
ncbi:two-component system sensor histidine kinase NtrB [Desulfurispira natronophila]|uniref:histidine kinase n=1 Tax=Desulfurispira natronophila TaxID=682562 RepID=A0A7W7Y3N4_9BACT|nr:ATP-binding protein [Desulfurispira natronophila]MBB5021485.1 two-component system sensor histidine kinase FlrB [Desulfurispira natronophila]